MHTIKKKLEAGSLITKEDLVTAILQVLSRQSFEDFYHTAYEDYISGVAITTKEKEVAEKEVTEAIEHLFSDILLVAPFCKINFSATQKWGKVL